MINFSISQANKQIIMIMIAIAFIALGIGSFLVSNFLTYFLGIFAGTGFSILKLLLLEITLKKSLNMEPKKATNYVNLHYSFRYLLTGIFLFIAIKREDISTLGTVIGLLSLRPAIYIVNFMPKKN